MSRRRGPSRPADATESTSEHRRAYWLRTDIFTFTAAELVQAAALDAMTPALDPWFAVECRTAGSWETLSLRFTRACYHAAHYQQRSPDGTRADVEAREALGAWRAMKRAALGEEWPRVTDVDARGIMSLAARWSLIGSEAERALAQLVLAWIRE